MTNERAPAVTPIALGIAILAVSTASILIRFAQQYASSISIAALRMTIATVALAPVVLARDRAELGGLGRRRLLLGFMSGGFLAIHFGTWITSLQYTSVASSVVFVSTGPLWVALLSPLLLRERMKGGAVVGLALALLGGLAIAVSDSCEIPGDSQCAAAADSSATGDLLALLGAFAVSGYLMLGRSLRRTVSLRVYIFVAYGAAALFLLLAALISGSPVLGLPASAYTWIILLALVPQLVGHSTYNWALRYLPAAAVAVTTLGEPVGSAILAYFILNETPGAVVLIGGTLILAGLYVAARASAAQGVRAAEPST